MIRPEGMATVVRTAAAGVSQAELIADLGVLIRMWHGILESYKRAPAPSLIHKDMNLVFKAARDFITPEVDRVLIDNAEEFEKVRDFMRLLGPQYVDRIEHYNSGRSLFKDFKIDEEVQKLLRPKINLPSGGSIVIETTEALTVIDVNSGKFTGGKNLEDTIVKTNIEAAAEIARQVRLRDIGGIIVCDFIDMSTENARSRVITTLENGSAQGPHAHDDPVVLGTRPARIHAQARRQGSLGPTARPVPHVRRPRQRDVAGIRRDRSVPRDPPLRSRARAATGPHTRRSKSISAPTVGAQIEYWYEDEMAGLERELDTKIAVRVDAALHPERTRIEALPDLAAATAPPPNVRVGDELEVELVHARLPIATSALAIVGDRLVEVENAANAVGETIKIKIIDIDDDGTILAEPRSSVRPLRGRGEEAPAPRRSRPQERTHGGGAGRAAARAGRGSRQRRRRPTRARHLDDGRSGSRGCGNARPCGRGPAPRHRDAHPSRARIRSTRRERRRPRVRELRRSGRRRRSPSPPSPPPPPGRRGRDARSLGSERRSGRSGRRPIVRRPSRAMPRGSSRVRRTKRPPLR